MLSAALRRATTSPRPFSTSSTPLRKPLKDWDLSWLLGPSPEQHSRAYFLRYRRVGRFLALLGVSLVLFTGKVIVQVHDPDTGELRPGFYVEEEAAARVQMKYYGWKRFLFGRPGKNEGDEE